MSTTAASKYQKFARDILWVAMAQVLTSLFAIITLPALTKTYSTETYGIWVQANVTVGLIVPVLTLQFGIALVRFLCGEEDKLKRRRTLGAMLCAILILAGLLLIVVNILAQQFSLLLFSSPDYSTLVRLVFGWTIIDALFVFFISYLRARGQMRGLSIIQMAFSAIKIGVIVILALSGLGLEWLIIGVIGVELLFVLGMGGIIISEDGFPIPDFKEIRGFLAFSAPQIPGALLMWLIESGDRFFITHFLNLSQTAIYSSSSSLAGIIGMIYSSISFVLFPAVTKAWEENRLADVKTYFEYSFKLFLTLAIPAAVGLTMLSQPLLQVLTTAEYLAGWQLILLIAIGTIFLGIFQINTYVIYLVKQTKWIPLAVILASSTSVMVNYILIPRIGILGAAISNIVSYFLLAAVVSIWARKVFRFSIDFKYLAKIMMAAIVMAAGLHFLDVKGNWGIVIFIFAGVAIFSLAVLLSGAFSKQDKLLVKQTLTGIIPWL